MDHDGHSSIAQKRSRTFLQRDIWIFDIRLGFPILTDREILHVAGVMSLGIFEAVLLAFRIEMSAGRLEV